jgi:hypothetical protein
LARYEYPASREGRQTATTATATTTTISVILTLSDIVYGCPKEVASSFILFLYLVVELQDNAILNFLKGLGFSGCNYYANSDNNSLLQKGDYTHGQSHSRFDQ